MIGDARLRELAKIGAEYRHWTVGDDYIIYGHGHDEVAPHECSHPDCVLVRAGTPAPADTPERTTALDLLIHLQRGHTQTTRGRFIECSCGTTFWGLQQNQQFGEPR